MSEGLLYASTTPGGYAIGKADGFHLAREQAIELFLAGNWITGHIISSSMPGDPSRVHNGEDLPPTTGVYHLIDNEVDDPVTEASEESFPASDPPAWPVSRQGKDHIINGSYFVADKDGSICGLCTGMRVRTREM